MATKRRVGNAVVRIGTYKDRSGQEKGEYVTLGPVLADERAVDLVKDVFPLSVRLRVLPLPNDKGEVWITLYPLRDKEGGEEAPF